MSIELETPTNALLALAGLPPLALALLGSRRLRAARASLGLEPQSGRAALVRPALVALVFALLGLAAARPLVVSDHPHSSRPDAQLMFVLDNTRSMLASRTASEPRRWQNAATIALRIRDSLPTVPAGISALSDRVLPYLFPTPDRAAFARTLARSYRIESPPPFDTLPQVSTFEPLSALPNGFFDDEIAGKVAVLVSDCESRPYEDTDPIGTLLSNGIEVVALCVGTSTDRIYLPDRIERWIPAAKRPPSFDATFSEADVSGAIAAVRGLIGSGSRETLRTGTNKRSLAAPLATAAIAPLVLLLAYPGLTARLRLRPTGGRLPLTLRRRRPQRARPNRPAAAG